VNRWESDLRGVSRRRRAFFAPVLVGLVAAGWWVAVASPPAAASSTTWIGPRVGADALANTRIGGPYGTTLAFRFRPTWSGSVTGVRFYIVVNSGATGEYSGGDGGILRVSLVAGGDGGLPSATELASAQIHPRTDAISFPLVRFGTPPQVVAGHDYDIVFTNTSPQPATNWVSVNALIGHGDGAAPPPLALAGSVLLGDSTDGGATPENWRPRAQGPDENYLPIMDVEGAGKGQHVGLGYMESWVSNPKPIDGSSAVRELFTYGRPHAARVLQALVRVRRTGDHVGPLSVRLESPDGRALAVSNVPGAQVPSDGPGWVSATFRKPPLLRKGEKLALVLRSHGGTFEAFPLRKGLAFGFDGETVFTDGYAQFSRAGSWTGWDQWGDTNRSDGDLQFALRLRT
jgi:hypothetical protein